MTKEEVKTMVELNNKFLEDAERVGNKMRKYDSDYQYVDIWRLEDESVIGEGDVYSRGCYMETVCPTFDVELLSYTDEELDAYVDKLIEEKKRKEEEKKKEAEKRQRENEIRMYNTLKEKLGL